MQPIIWPEVRFVERPNCQHEEVELHGECSKCVALDIKMKVINASEREGGVKLVMLIETLKYKTEYRGGY